MATDWRVGDKIQEFKPGDYIEERYRVYEVLKGGMGRVYVAYDIALDQLVAIKTLHPRFLSNERAIESFLSEAKTWILLERHPHIVQAKSTFLIGQQPFIVVEYVDGGNLRLMLQNRVLDMQLALELAIQFCAGAAYAYSKLILIHRDIKPENLLLTKRGTLKITDFGLSRVGEELQERGKWMGTLLYIPPEQWADSESVTKQSDIYSFGFVLYEMLTGQHPFLYKPTSSISRTIEKLRKAHEEEIPPEPKTIKSEIPDELSAIVMKCIEKNPIRRFLYHEDLAEQLQQAYKLYTGHKYIHQMDEETNETLDSQAELLNNGDSLFTIGKYSEALVYYTRLLKLAPQSAIFWQRMGEALARLDRHHEAELYFGKALEIEPSNLGAVKGKVRCLINMGRRREALACCSPALALNPNDRDLLRLKQELLTSASEPSIGATSVGQPLDDENRNAQGIRRRDIVAWNTQDSSDNGIIS